MRGSARILVVVLLAAAFLTAVAAGCPLCRDAKSDTDYPGGSASLPKGFFYSILLMVSAPFLVVGGLIFRISLSRRRARGLPLAAVPSDTPAVPSDRPAGPLLPRGARP